MQRKLIALALLLCLLPLAACGGEAEKPPFADTLCIDYITPEDEVYAREPELEAAVASMLRSAIPDAPDISVNLRRRERFGPVEGESAPDGEIVLAPKMNANGTLDFDALAFDIACSIAGGMGLGEEVIAALGRAIEITVVTTSTAKATDVVTTTTTTQATTAQTTTKAPTTTTKKPETAPAKWDPSQVKTVADLNAVSEPGADSGNTVSLDMTFAEKPKRATVSNHEGNWEIVRARCTSENYYTDGAVFYVFLDKKRNGALEYVGAVQNKNFAEHDYDNLSTFFILSRGSIETNQRGSVATDAHFYLVSTKGDNTPPSPGADVSVGTGSANVHPSILELGSAQIYKLNSSGTGFYEIKASDLK